MKPVKNTESVGNKHGEGGKGRISNFRGTYFLHPCNPLSAQQRGEKWCENLKCARR